MGFSAPPVVAAMARPSRVMTNTESMSRRTARRDSNVASIFPAQLRRNPHWGASMNSRTSALLMAIRAMSSM